MRKILIGALCFFILSACKKDTGKKMTVVKDCTGSYLRSEGKDYHVCNTEKTEGFKDGTTVMASFKKIDKCTGAESDKIVCMMYHENEGWIEISGIKTP